MIGTVFIVLTMTCYAGDERIALSASWTNANGLMILWLTQGMCAAAYIAIGAGIDAVFIDAGLVIGTVGIDFTFSCVGVTKKVSFKAFTQDFKRLTFIALHLRITTPACRTEASGTTV